MFKHYDSRVFPDLSRTAAFRDMRLYIAGTFVSEKIGFVATFSKQNDL
jgi:hypothetical protein